VKTIKPKDNFPPATPTGVTAVPGTRSIELVWNRNTEKDFASYNVYRDGMKIADGLTAPAFSDRGAQPKVKVQYQVSAVDTAGNESARSAAVEAAIP
jgi:fibronectin type 3 domain-containing protein